MIKKLLTACLSVFFTLSTPALAGGHGHINILAPYMKSAYPAAPAGGVFFCIENKTHHDDRLIEAQSDIARRVEIHTHIMEDGVAKMRALEGGIEIDAGERHDLVPGGDHVMLMGLKKPLEDGDTVDLVLVFEKSGKMALSVPVNRGKDAPECADATAMHSEEGHSHNHTH